MQQMDLFENNSDIFLQGEIEKLKNSMDRRTRSIFALLTELQDEILKMKEKDNEERRAVHAVV